MEILGFYHPKTLKEALELLGKYKNCRVLAGGTDLVLNLSREDEKAEYLIDLSKLSELSGITEKDGTIELGSMVTFTQMKESRIIKDNYKSLEECAKNMGSPQIRNMATLGGNIANGGSAADAVPCIISLKGSLIIQSLEGQRTVSCEEYFKNYNEEKLRDNEIITKIVLPKEGNASGFYKLGKRNSLAIARVCAAVNLKVDNNVVTDLTICLGAVGRHPFRAYEAEKAALGKAVDYLMGDEVAGLLEASVYDSIKGRKTMPFKKEAIKGVFKQAMKTALELK